MLPSNKVAPVEELLARFLRQLQPYESAIEPAINGFFSTLREIMMLINPLALRDSVAAIYETIRQKSAYSRSRRNSRPPSMPCSTR